MTEGRLAYARLQKAEDSDDDEDGDLHAAGLLKMPDKLIALPCEFNTYIPKLSWYVMRACMVYYYVECLHMWMRTFHVVILK